MKSTTVPLLQKEFIRLKKEEEALATVLYKIPKMEHSAISEQFRKRRSAMTAMVFELVKANEDVANVDFVPLRDRINELLNLNIDPSQVDEETWADAEPQLAIYEKLDRSAGLALGEFNRLILKPITIGVENVSPSTRSKAPKPVVECADDFCSIAAA